MDANNNYDTKHSSVQSFCHLQIKFISFNFYYVYIFYAKTDTAES